MMTTAKTLTNNGKDGRDGKDDDDDDDDDSSGSVDFLLPPLLSCTNNIFRSCVPVFVCML